MIFIICALHCEAKPIIEKYKLQADREAFFPVFKKVKNTKITLVVTGVGKIATASAMAYVFAREKEPAYAAWLNVGVAGMKTADVGALYNINKVTDENTGVNWYPVRLPLLSTATNLNCAVITVDAPSDNYTEKDAYDMEASAFMATALRFSSVELIQLVKIISDNVDNAMQEINKKRVTELVIGNIEAINNVVDALFDASKSFESSYGNVDLYQQCISEWHFSEYQQKQLQRILQQWLALDDDASFDVLSTFKSSKQVISFVNDQLNVVAVDFKL